MTTKE